MVSITISNVSQFVSDKEINFAKSSFRHFNENSRRGHSLSLVVQCNRNFNCAFSSAVKVVKGNFSGENQFFSASHRAEFYGDQKARNFIVA